MDLEDLRRRLSRRRPRRAKAAGAREAAVAVVLAGGASGPELLLIKRAEHPADPWSGQMALPGGRRDPGDSDLFATARRETLEETGVGLAPAELLGELDDLAPRSSHLPRIVVRPFVFVLAGKPRIRPSREVAGHVWVSLADLRAGACRASVEVRGERLEVRGFRVGEQLVWGMTERILAQFLGLL